MQDWEPVPTGDVPVFHYTDALGLLGILESGTLWAHEAAGLNDTAEVVYGWDYIGAWLAERKPTRAVDWVISVAKNHRPGTSNPTEVFVLSASRVSDDANQWRLYGDNGRGYAVELNPREGLVVASHKFERDRESWMKIADVSQWVDIAYDDRVRDKMLRSLLAFARPLGPRANRDAWLSRWDADDPFDVARALGRAANTMKAPGFAGEQESRVFATLKSGEGHVSFRAGRFGVTRYVALTSAAPKPTGGISSRDSTVDLDKQWRVPIRSVTLGPAHNAELAAPAVRALLARHGYTDVAVKPSQVTLR